MVNVRAFVTKATPSSQYTGTAQNSSRNYTLRRCDRCHVISFQNFGSDTSTNTTKTVWIYKNKTNEKHIFILFQQGLMVELDNREEEMNMKRYEQN